MLLSLGVQDNQVIRPVSDKELSVMHNVVWWTKSESAEPAIPVSWEEETWLSRCRYVSWQQAFVKY